MSDDTCPLGSTQGVSNYGYSISRRTTATWIGKASQITKSFNQALCRFEKRLLLARLPLPSRKCVTLIDEIIAGPLRIFPNHFVVASGLASFGCFFRGMGSFLFGAYFRLDLDQFRMGSKELKAVPFEFVN